MMAPTHVVVGLALGAAVATVEPSLGTAAAIGGAIGGAAPDVDLFVGQHRRTLHAPALLFVPAALAAGLALAAPTPLAVAVAVAFLAAAVHSASDALGAGEELRPWERTNPNAVYCHAAGRWLRARYVVPYDGAPRDFLVTAAFAVPVVLVFSGPIRWLTLALVAGAGVYTALRKRLPKYFEPIVE
ncbi:hypothetical protein SAMN05216388_1004156 [Halorientalis persicus]|jgi:membrane-bound metal-dependent hydrolase YbcI (DUF457 family)|uniref:LexA-binding, inner membrane-associated hydrolase n=1 Tax=Halorientalis persicus TaxID=1367881 RepID=A0A1H8II25_9EURY|nr:hypothetical protein SAMN05216388_1004156 [Halorientalis persicus]